MFNQIMDSDYSEYSDCSVRDIEDELEKSSLHENTMDDGPKEMPSNKNTIKDEKKIIEKITNDIMDYNAAHDAKIQEMYETISDKNKTIEQLTEQVKQKDMEINKYKAELEKMRTENDAKIKEVKAAANSINSKLISDSIENRLIIGYYGERYSDSNKCLDDDVSKARDLIDTYMTLTRNLTDVTGRVLSKFIYETFNRDTVTKVAYSYLFNTLDEYSSGTLRESKYRIHSIVYNLLSYLDNTAEKSFNFDKELKIIRSYFQNLPKTNKSNRTPHTLFITKNLKKLYKYSAMYDCDRGLKRYMVE